MPGARLLDRIAARLASRHELRVRPHVGPVPGGERPPGLGGKSGALRAAIFGVNDGLVSNLALIMGVTGGAVSNRVVLLAGVAGLLAGAFSMAGGEYVSMRVQRELFERLIHLEAHELGTDPEGERRELQRIYEARGFPRELAAQVSEALMRDPRLALETHAREELGLDPTELGAPWAAAVSSFFTFAVGAAVPLLPFVFGSGLAAALASVAASGTALFGVGAAMSVLTGRPAWASGLRMLVIGGSLAAVTFGVGRALHVGVAP
ncbi:MAG TPA: VIT1/CCC1 transporter family protein [Actinomycetota bacterium]|nr:VIT1/CCC1 transporter family protein [Actinomycetota bacterium]